MLKPNLLDKALDEAYLAMAEDMAREAEAVVWCNGLAGDIGDMADQIMAADEARLKTRLGVLS